MIGNGRASRISQASPHAAVLATPSTSAPLPDHASVMGSWVGTRVHSRGVPGESSQLYRKTLASRQTDSSLRYDETDVDTYRKRGKLMH